jgi:transketolase N-terminal domain/subunit
MKERILQISKALGLSHIGSCTSVLPVLDEIYKKKNPEDKVIMSGAHAHLAHLVVMEAYEGLENIEELIKRDIHCNREVGCDATGGSLAHSGIALGMALVNRDRDVYLIMTDGSLGEGEEWEVMRIKRELQLTNLHIYCSINGFSAVSKIDKEYLKDRILAFCPDAQVRFTQNAKGFEGVDGHYKAP